MDLYGYYFYHRPHPIIRFRLKIRLEINQALSMSGWSWDLMKAKREEKVQRIIKRGMHQPIHETERKNKERQRQTDMITEVVEMLTSGCLMIKCIQPIRETRAKDKRGKEMLSIQCTVWNSRPKSWIKIFQTKVKFAEQMQVPFGTFSVAIVLNKWNMRSH